MSTPLLPCPWRGSTDLLPVPTSNSKWVTCNQCHCDGPVSHDLEDAKATWNIRPTPSPASDSPVPAAKWDGLPPALCQHCQKPLPMNGPYYMLCHCQRTSLPAARGVVSEEMVSAAIEAWRMDWRAAEENNTVASAGRSAMRAAISAALSQVVGGEAAKLDDNRCARCGWTLAKDAKDGCVRGNCSYRPEPPLTRDRFYDAKRWDREIAAPANRHDEKGGGE